MKRLAWGSFWLIACGLLILMLASLPEWVYRPLIGRGYQLWSGIASDVGEVTLLVGLISGMVATHRFLHQHFECHEQTCHRLGFHRVHDQDGKPTPYLTCWAHHPVLPGGHEDRHSVPLAHIDAAARSSRRATRAI